MNRFRIITVVVCFFALGLVLGAASIHRPISNAPLELPPARKPWSPKDIMGLIGSMGIRTFAGHLKTIPRVVLETDRSFALELSAAKANVHYVIVPKKDISSIGEISSEDQSYLIDVFLTARHLIEKEGLRDYRIYTNGSDLQSVGYLHFHLVGRRETHKREPIHIIK